MIELYSSAAHPSGIGVSGEREGGCGEVDAAAGEGVGRAVHQPRGAVEQDLGHGGVGQGAEGQDQVSKEGCGTRQGCDLGALQFIHGVQ